MSALFKEWTVELVEGQLRMSREPTVARDSEVARVSPGTLAARLSELPAGQVTRISVGRYRGPFQHGDREYAEVIELGGFLVSGPCTSAEITDRYGRGDYRISAYGFEPAGLRWEVHASAIIGPGGGRPRKHGPGLRLPRLVAALEPFSR